MGSENHNGIDVFCYDGNVTAKREVAWVFVFWHGHGMALPRSATTRQHNIEK